MIAIVCLRRWREPKIRFKNVGIFIPLYFDLEHRYAASSVFCFHGTFKNMVRTFSLDDFATLSLLRTRAKLDEWCASIVKRCDLKPALALGIRHADANMSV